MPETQPRTALLSAPGSSEDYPEDWISYDALDALLDDRRAELIIVDLPANQALNVLRKLRADDRYHFTLILLKRDADVESEILADGRFADYLTAIDQWQHIQEKLAHFNRGRSPERFEERVLAWLWTRTDSRIVPLREPAHAQHYRYPLLETLAQDEELNELTWLRLMEQQQLIEQVVLVDRIRLCVECGSGRLNFIDVCPDCSSIEIQRQPALHCFTCGHVAPQDSFLKNGLLLCPNCMTRLRHIGTDYDRPMENYRCLSCHAFFIDAEVEARCFECGHAHLPEDLRIREIVEYRLSETGRVQCRQGFDDIQGNESFGRLSLIAAPVFKALLNWQIQQLHRYGSPPCSLLRLRFVNLTRTLESLGSMRGLSLIESLVERIQQSIRDTDRCTRTSEEVLWILLPHTDEKGMQVLRDRLRSLADLFPDDDTFELALEVTGACLPEALEQDENSDLLMARLASEGGG